MPDSRDLEAFLAVAEELNFTRAAERLLVAQPALSSRIRRLERELGVQLFERTTRHVALTQAGSALADYGRVALSVLDQAWLMARQVGDGEEGQIRLAYSPSTGSDTVPVLLERLAARHPHLRIITTMVPSAQAVRTVATADADLAVVRGRPRDPQVRAVRVRDERRGALLSEDHPLSDRDFVSLADVSAWPVLLHAREANPVHHDELRALFTSAGLTAQFHEPTATYDVGRHLVRSGKAIALVGESSQAALPGGVRWVPLCDPGTTIRVYLVLPTRSMTAPQRRFRDSILDAARELGWLAAGDVTGVAEHRANHLERAVP